MTRTAEEGGWQRNGSALCVWALFSAGLSKQCAWERVALVQCVGCEGQCVSFGITIWIISSSYRKWEGITVMTHPLPSDISFCLLRPLVSRQWRSATLHWRRSNFKHRLYHVFRLVERSRKWLEHRLVWDKTQNLLHLGWKASWRKIIRPLRAKENNTQMDLAEMWSSLWEEPVSKTVISTQIRYEQCNKYNTNWPIKALCQWYLLHVKCLIVRLAS
jgi:hypothetical protein